MLLDYRTFYKKILDSYSFLLCEYNIIQSWRLNHKKLNIGNRFKNPCGIYILKSLYYRELQHTDYSIQSLFIILNVYLDNISTKRKS